MARGPKAGGGVLQGPGEGRKDVRKLGLRGRRGVGEDLLGPGRHSVKRLTA